MTFEWDPGKADANRRKHGVDFADAVGVFEDPYALSRPDPFPAEERVATLGRDLLDRLIVVVWTWRGEAIRLISARRATPRERRRYAEDVDA
jgi:hypothetical protein